MSLPPHARQHDEPILTAAQSLFALALPLPIRADWRSCEPDRE